MNNDKIVEGLIKLGKEFKGKIYLEIFFVPNLNNTKEELTLLKEIATKIQPDLIQLNTLDRPGTEDFVKAVTKEELKKIKEFFEPLPIEIIAKAETRKQIQSFNKNIEEQILETIKRRPCTDIDLTEILDIHLNELNKYLSELIDSKKIESEHLDRGLFFKIKKKKL